MAAADENEEDDEGEDDDGGDASRCRFTQEAGKRKTAAVIRKNAAFLPDFTPR